MDNKEKIKPGTFFLIIRKNTPTRSKRVGSDYYQEDNNKTELYPDSGASYGITGYLK